MKYTNEAGLDEVQVAVAMDCLHSHPEMADNNVYSVTELLKSPKQIYMKRAHGDEIELDIADCANSILGTIYHKAMEMKAQELGNYITETRLEYDLGDGLTLTGAFDRLDTKDWTLTDYKTSKSATVENCLRDEANDWHRQQKMYAIMIEAQYGKRPKRLNIDAHVMDFSKMKNYDLLGKAMLRFGWDEKKPSNQREIEDEQNFIEGFRDKAALVRDLLERRASIEDHPCSFDDCWCKEDWAIIKQGNKVATKTFTNEHDARLALPRYQNGKDGDRMRLYHRVSDAKMCSKYCDCRGFCKQGKEMCGLQLKEDITDIEEELPF